MWRKSSIEGAALPRPARTMRDGGLRGSVAVRYDDRQPAEVFVAPSAADTTYAQDTEHPSGSSGAYSNSPRRSSRSGRTTYPKHAKRVNTIRWYLSRRRPRVYGVQSCGTHGPNA